MRLVCIRSVNGKFGTKKNAPNWKDLFFPIKGLIYTAVITRTDMEGDVGYIIDGLDGWWSSTLFRDAELSDFMFESMDEILETILTDVT